MNLAVQIILGIIAGIVSSFSTNQYSKIVEKRKKEWERILVYVLYIPFFFAPLVLLIFAYERTENEVHLSEILVSWISTYIFYIVVMRKVLKTRLASPKQTGANQSR
jgi:phosphotransferase system  glucose/maltose/N-acetylglucosamine-specific IIC component